MIFYSKILKTHDDFLQKYEHSKVRVQLFWDTLYTYSESIEIEIELFLFSLVNIQ